MLDRAKMIAAMIAHAEGHIEKHKMNVEVYLKNPVGVGEHPDVFEAIEQELLEMAKYHDVIEMCETYLD